MRIATLIALPLALAVASVRADVEETCRNCACKIDFSGNFDASGADGLMNDITFVASRHTPGARYTWDERPALVKGQGKGATWEGQVQFKGFCMTDDDKKKFKQIYHFNGAPTKLNFFCLPCFSAS